LFPTSLKVTLWPVFALPTYFTGFAAALARP
jgi:hypothetical protein